MAAAQQLDSAQGSVDTSLGQMQEALDAVAEDLEQDTGTTLVQVRSMRCGSVHPVDNRRFAVLLATEVVWCRALWVWRRRAGTASVRPVRASAALAIASASRTAQTRKMMTKPLEMPRRLAVAMDIVITWRGHVHAMLGMRDRRVAHVTSCGATSGRSRCRTVAGHRRPGGSTALALTLRGALASASAFSVSVAS